MVFTVTQVSDLEVKNGSAASCAFLNSYRRVTYFKLSQDGVKTYPINRTNRIAVTTLLIAVTNRKLTSYSIACLLDDAIFVFCLLIDIFVV